ncbi:bifunctional lytic transglycosylase/amino acid ABC transporter substrate-binding protein [Pseudomonas alcaligenes]|uniref:Bifunctional lytic transglycosylase/amino acid ABC transporter substrate-binding protein n=1 Tax=Aquipseudomonas alcaligenes TaxID=43263 RepID=A0ABR7RWY8_AQUAC|nr:transporter substrate-binding domain-containing protein [Pseudomonas alcaligenes]MBC9249304.1 bifunctional lytic transglycosylase/amino acid ABC transporter substrate-binding protein [Pseudomonas alcaligenes]
MPRLLLAVLLVLLSSAAAHAQAPAPANVVHVGYYEFPPYSWTDTDGKPQGSILALTERLLRHAGYRGEYRSLPGARLYAAVRDGSVQLWPGAGGKSELQGHTFEARNSLGEISLALYRRAGTPAPAIPLDLRDKSVIVISGYSYWKSVNDLLADPALGITTHRTSTHASALEMLLRKRGDYLLDYQAPVEQTRKTLGLSPLPVTVLQRMPLRLIASRHAPGSQQLLEQLDSAYDELRASGHDLDLK